VVLDLDSPTGLTWRQDTRTLWTIDQQGGEIGTLDTTTGAFTRVFTAVPANGWEGIDHDVAACVFYLINQDANLYALSPTTRYRSRRWWRGPASTPQVS
jgi:hypothetical protein